MDIKNLEKLLKEEPGFLSNDDKLLKSKIKECAQSVHLNMIKF